jgi:glutamine synthetase
LPPGHRHRRLLRARRERPCSCAAEKRDELAAPHSITSSASSALPDEMLRVFNHYKRDEWERFMATSTEWDLRTYLDYLP